MASQTPRGGSRRLALAGPTAGALARLRGGLIGAALAQGSRVLALAPDVSAGEAEGLLKLGAEVSSIALRPPGFTLFRRRRAVAVLAGQLRDWHPDTLLIFGAPVIALCVVAARRARVPHVAVLVSEIPAAGFAKRVRVALRAADTLIAHNIEDELALRTLVAGTKAQVVRVPGRGAELTITPGCAMPLAGEPLVFLAASRLDRIKGVHDYLEAARICKDKGLAAKFVLAGPDGSQAGAVKADTLARYASAVQYVGDRADVVTAIQDAHVFVSPSHVEGMPPAVLTALAAGRPIVATDIAGSRETVDEMVNGTLVAPSNPPALAEGFMRMVQHRDLLAAMGRASRAKAERVFAAPQVNAALLKALGLA